MCNISAIWKKEANISQVAIEKFIEAGKKRGTDGMGIMFLGEDRSNKYVVRSQFKSHKVEDQFNNLIRDALYMSKLIICNHRAAPETEPECQEIDTIQPIKNGDIVLVHNGAVSNRIVQEMYNDPTFECESKLDSEAIIWAYKKFNRDIVKTMEYLSGGFSFMLFDTTRQRLIVVCTHNPLYCGAVRGYGVFWNSQQEPIWEMISDIKGQTIKSHNQNWFEDYYVREVNANTIEEWDMSGVINTYKFTPRYITYKYDPWMHTPKRYIHPIVLVAASGGLDSTTTLATLQHAGYTPIAVHFTYGHRGGDSEFLAIQSITDKLDIQLKVFDLTDIIGRLDNGGMLTDKNASIITGTDAGLKTTAAWTCWRNGLFVNIMGALAESLIVKDNLEEVFITGGFLNLTESGVYGDNSERFMNSFINFAKFSSIVGTKIKPLYGLCNVLKSEQYVLLTALGLIDKLSPYLISCDRPKVINGIPHNCSKNGIPACGSGLLSYWASKIAGLDDGRRYYEIDEEYTAFVPNSTLKGKALPTYESIVNKLEIPEENKKILLLDLSLKGIDHD